MSSFSKEEMTNIEFALNSTLRHLEQTQQLMLSPDCRFRDTTGRYEEKIRAFNDLIEKVR